MHLAMGDENENFFWENQPWIISDNSGGDVGIDVLVGVGAGAGAGVAGEDQDKGKKGLDSSTSKTNSPNIVGGDDVATLMVTGIGKKRSGGGGGGCSSKRGNGGGEGKGGGESDHEIHIWTERERRKKMRNMFSSLHDLLPQLPPKADKSTIVDEAVSYIKSLQQTLQNLQKQKLERLHGGMSVPLTNFADPSSSSRLLLSQQKLVVTRESFMADHQGSSSTNNLAIISSPTSNSNSFSNIIPRMLSPMSFHIWTSPNVVLNVCGEEAQISICSFKKAGMLSMICYVLDKHRLEVVSAHVSGDNFRRMYMIQTRGNYVDYQLPEGYLIEEAFKQAAAEMMIWVTNN